MDEPIPGVHADPELLAGTPVFIGARVPVRALLETTGGRDMKNYRAARKRVNVSVGESVRIIRELQGQSQNELAQRSGISQATISAIENDRVKLGVERAKMLAQALRCHPGVLVFRGWVVPTEAAA